MRTGLALALVLGLASVASAAMVSAANNDPAAPLQIQYEATAIGGGLTSFAVYVVGPTGAKLSSFDGRFDGPTNQVQTTGPSAWSVDLTNADMRVKDTHFLFNESDAAIVRGPSETVDAGWTWVEYVNPTPPPPSFWAQEGVGTWFAHDAATTMALGIVGTAQTDSLQMIQLVIPDGEQVVMTGSLGIAGAGGMAIGLGGNGVIIPEPVTISMLLLGGLGLITRRRR